MIKKKRGVIKKQGFFERFFAGYKDSWKFITSSKNHLLLILFVFLASALIGVLFPDLFGDQIRDYLIGIYEKVKDFGFWQLFLFIITNNVSSAFFSFALGLFLGIFPVIMSVINGYVLGFVAGKSVSVQGLSVLWRLLPHGIFELPAIFLSMSIGLRIGLCIFSSSGRRNFRSVFVQSFFVFLRFVIPLLIIAGIIESTLIILVK